MASQFTLPLLQQMGAGFNQALKQVWAKKLFDEAIQFGDMSSPDFMNKMGQALQLDPGLEPMAKMRMQMPMQQLQMRETEADIALKKAHTDYYGRLPQEKTDLSLTLEDDLRAGRISQREYMLLKHGYPSPTEDKTVTRQNKQKLNELERKKRGLERKVLGKYPQINLDKILSQEEQVPNIPQYIKGARPGEFIETPERTQDLDVLEWLESAAELEAEMTSQGIRFEPKVGIKAATKNFSEMSDNELADHLEKNMTDAAAIAEARKRRSKK